MNKFSFPAFLGPSTPRRVKAADFISLSQTRTKLCARNSLDVHRSCRTNEEKIINELTANDKLYSLLKILEKLNFRNNTLIFLGRKSFESCCIYI